VVEKLRPGAADPGDIVHIDGRVMGRHQGIIHYTIGQRRGLGIGGENDPLFVVRLEPATHRVIVGPKAALARDQVTLRGLNWLPGEPLTAEGRRIEVKLRSVSEPAPATLFPRADGGADVILDDPQFGISPGQAAVCYDGSRVLGGGWIAAAESRLAA
jgi:tRNA-specific 2-thiouridylase